MMNFKGSFKGHPSEPGVISRSLRAQCPNFSMPSPRTLRKIPFFLELTEDILELIGLVIVGVILISAIILFNLGADWRDVKLTVPLIYYNYRADAPYQWASCARFRCNSNINQCDNADETDFTGDELNPPCCVHLLRDMLRILDEEFVKANINYYTSRGSLLGLVRSDRLIPWTADNDISLTEQEIKKVETIAFNTSLRRRGLGLVSELIDRVCFTEDYMNGVLKKWPDPFQAIYREKYPYTDMYPEPFDTDKKKYPNVYSIIGCRYHHETLYPTKRLSVYKNSFSINVPNKAENYLNYTYGEDWRVPDQARNAFGSHMSYCHDGDPKIVG